MLGTSTLAVLLLAGRPLATAYYVNFNNVIVKADADATRHAPYHIYVWSTKCVLFVSGVAVVCSGSMWVENMLFVMKTHFSVSQVPVV